MRFTTPVALTAAALLAVGPAAALAQQTSPAPVMTMAPAPASPAASSAPASAAPAAPAGAASAAPASTTRSSLPGTRSTNVNSVAKHIKKIPTTTLTDAQVQYALTHVPQTAVRLRAMKKISFNNLSVYRLTAAQKAKYHVAMLGAPVQVAELNADFVIAQTGGTAANILQNVLANVNVSDALNNVLNGTNVGVNATVSLADVLNNVNVGVGQVVGLYIGTGGKVTTIVG